MSYRPYPSRERALNNLCRQRAVYLYGRVPQRYVMGYDAMHAEAPPVGEYRLSTRRRVVTVAP